MCRQIIQDNLDTACHVTCKVTERNTAYIV